MNQTFFYKGISYQMVIYNLGDNWLGQAFIQSGDDLTYIARLDYPRSKPQAAINYLRILIREYHDRRFYTVGGELITGSVRESPAYLSKPITWVARLAFPDPVAHNFDGIMVRSKAGGDGYQIKGMTISTAEAYTETAAYDELEKLANAFAEKDGFILQPIPQARGYEMIKERNSNDRTF